jgi:N-acetylglucosamine kinase-like BadF-type ATPase
VIVSNDAVIAQWGGLGGQPGVAVLAGTGSIALARGADGREARSGGYGYLVSDEVSGYWLGREAIAACLKALDGRAPPTALADSLIAATKRASVADLVGWLYSGQSQVRRSAPLAPLVARAADAGDAVAIDILERAARALAELVLAATRQVWGDAPPHPLPVARCGGVWAAGPRLVEPFDRAVQSMGSGASFVQPRSQLSDWAG